MDFQKKKEKVNDCSIRTIFLYKKKLTAGNRLGFLVQKAKYSFQELSREG
jgi:hypothetical protein